MKLTLRDVFYFDEMLTPKIITVVYWILIFLVAISGLGTMFSGQGIASLFGGILIIIVGVISVRIWCEILIVIFKIHENLKIMVDK